MFRLRRLYARWARFNYSVGYNAGGKDEWEKYDFFEETSKNAELATRKQIAREILDYAEANHPKHESNILCQRCDITAAYRNAAAIARGEK